MPNPKIKIKPNDPCPCGSGSKYKKCCENKQNVLTKYELGQEVSSDIIIACVNVLKSKYKNSKFIDITDDLTEESYKEYQLKNYNTNIVMIAEKTDKNIEVFLTRINEEESDIMVFHKGYYRTFAHKNVERILESISNII
jgi:hypothetical protein